MIRKNEKKETKKFSTTEMVLLVIMSLLIGLSIGGLLNKANIITKKPVIYNDNLKELINNYTYIVDNYYKTIDERKLVNSAIDGMMQALDDPYSMYFDETEMENFNISLEGSYEGVGIQIVKNEETKNILVTSVFKNSAASKAGLKVGDEIVLIDGKKTVDYDVSEFSSLIKESDKKSFELEILREGKKTSLTLTKGLVTLDSIVSEVYEKGNKKIGYIYIGIFASNTYFQFKDALDELENKQIDALIIDVRGNTGGHLTSVDSILDIFLTSKQKMYGMQKNEQIEYTYGTGENKKNYEVVLLGDETSASASEVLISSLQENLNAKFFGKRTYGKGTVQEMVTLSDGTQYKLTIKKWLTPTGKCVSDTDGVIPDVEVKLDDKYYETLLEEDDTQLKYALDYLKNS